MPSPVRILIAEPLDFSPEAVAHLRRIGEVDLRQCDREQLKAAFREYDVVWFRLAHRVDRTFFVQPLRCRILAVPVTGLDHIDLQACAEHNVSVVSLRGEYDFLKDIRATAELTIGLALSLLRRIPAAAADVLAGNWNRDRFRGRELFGKSIGLVGVGRLGQIVARYFRAFDAEVIGFDPRPDFPLEVARRVASLPELLNRSDLVSIHVNYQDSTRHLIGAREFEQFKPGSILVNTSRGGIVDEQALLAALESGRLAGAALDVLDGEPNITATHPVAQYARSHANVLIVPHIGGNTAESFAKTELFLADRVVSTWREISAA